MHRVVRVAAVQMRAEIGALASNLRKATSLVTLAAEAGARLIILPELFNTGYEYTEANYRLAEPPDGPTCAWMRETASRPGIHLGGSLLLRKDDDIFNTLVLAAPDGRTWEYDKLHPWGWERAYFRPGEAPVVADTDLGRLGLAICWDVAHASLFRAYAGQVQMLVASSCPPAMGRTEVCFADGRRLSFAGTSRLARIVRDQGDGVVDKDLRAQAAWLGVPLVSAMQHGLFASSVPRPVLSFALAVLPNPRLWPLVRHVTKATISAPYYEHTLVADAAGEVIARPDQGDSFAVADITIPEIPPRPTLPQPKRRLHPFAYWLTDVLSLLSRPEYDRRVPRKPSTLPHR